jgi:UDPglucose 6-dehydrogenase
VQHIYGLRPELKLVGTKEAALEKADALVICTEWKNFRAPNFNLLKTALRSPLLFDGRNLYDPAQMEEQGIEYYAVGRGKSVVRI